MVDLLTELSVIAGISITLITIILVGIIVVFTGHRYYGKHLSKNHTQIGRVLFRTSASLLALLLSFTYASQRVDYYNLKLSLEKEASKLVDIHIDLQLYNSPEAEEIKLKIYEYVGIMIEEGWTPITDNPFQARTSLQFVEIYNDIHTLEATTSFQQQLKESLLEDIDVISDNMQVRIYQTRPEMPFLFYIALFGFLVVMIFFSVYFPDKISIILISCYNAFIGLVLYFIIQMNNPLIGPLKIKPEPFFILKEAIEKEQSR